jgi:signal transduction histidine kinase/DNA-binding response OmpR family regulator
MGIWITATFAILAGVSFAQVRASIAFTERTEKRVLRNQQEKGHLLVSNQALALRGMALDNAFSDVGQLVRRTVQEDEDVIYGSFVDARGKPWIVVSPETGEAGYEGERAVGALAPLPNNKEGEQNRSGRTRVLSVFGERVEEHVQNVFDGKELLGSIRYGLSLSRTETTVRGETRIARQSLKQLLILVMLLGASAMVVGVAAIRKIASKITEPLALLAYASEQIAKGNRGFRAQISSGDELECLALTFNSMADANERTMTELEVKTAEALEASRLKSEFLANMSHEIRTPMNRILGVVRLVHKMPLEGKLRRYVETIDSSASSLLTIINDVLDFSKMEAGKYTLKCGTCDLRTVVQEVCELLATRAHDKGLELICRLDPRIHGLHEADPDRVRQVVNNLVGNAIKFTEKGEVFVDLRRVETLENRETLRLSVIDTGIGIAQADIDKLFDAFSQVDGSMIRKFGGTGLGLAISKRLVEMMGGAIGVKSALGEGSEFFCTIPFEVVNGPAEERNAWADDKLAVLVEEHPRWQEAIAEHLRVWGFRVEKFESATKAIDWIHSEGRPPVDVVVAETQSTGMAFKEVIRIIREIEGCKSVPIIALYRLGTSVPLSDIEKEVAALLPKPLRFSELYNVIQQNLRGGVPFVGERASTRSVPVAIEGQVLVVDDNEINRLVAQEMLEQLGYSVETAENGADGLERMKTNDFVLVLMDCQMPIMDGYEATKAIRDYEEKIGRRTTIVALTAHALSGEREKVLAAGMDDYLSKPVRPASLDKMIRRYAHPRNKEFKAINPQPPAEIEPELSVLDVTMTRSKKLIELFLRNIHGQIAAIESAYASRVVTEVQASAHKTKGSCLALGATGMANIAERIQKLAEKGEIGVTLTLTSELKEQLARVESALHRELDAL